MLVGLLAAALGALALLTLTPSAATEQFVGEGSRTAEATERQRAAFGEDAIAVLVEEDLAQLVLTSDLARLTALEGCLSGNAPKGVTPPGGRDGPCGRLARDKHVKVVFGPGTFIRESVRQIQQQFGAQTQLVQRQAREASRLAVAAARKRGFSQARAQSLGKQAADAVTSRFTQTLLQLAVRYGLRDIPRENDPNFVSQLVFDATKPAGTPKARFAYLFPTKGTALVQVRLKPGLDEESRRRTLDDVRAATRMDLFRLPGGGRYVVTGAPVVVADLTDALSRSVLVLLLAAVLVMALTLAAVFRAPRRLLPLGVALAATGITFGGLALLGGSLTMASIGVLPILIGLAVDYAIQLQSQIQANGLERAVREGLPAIMAAAAATAAGFAVLLLSPVPMVQGFGLLLVGGIVAAVLCALSLGVAGLAARGTRAPGAVRDAGEILAASARGAASMLAPAGRLLQRPSRALRGARDGRSRTLGLAMRLARRPRAVLGAGLAVAACGFVLDTQATVQSDIQELVPQDLAALRDLDRLQRSTGVGGQVDVVVRSDRLTSPEVVQWMTEFQTGVLEEFGYAAGRRGCGRAELCPAFSLPDLFRGGVGDRTQEDIAALLDAVPAYFSQGVVTADRRTATLAFGIKLMPLDRQQEVIDEIRSRLVDAPEGVTAEVAGLAALAAEANAEVSDPWRRLGTLLAGLLAVLLVLVVAFRTPRRAVVPLVPIVLATGWSMLLLAALRVELNPMSVVLGALVIAISTEFSVLLSERFRRERQRGLGLEEAISATYRSTGRAVMASGATAIAGFAVLVLSDVRMLRDFGLVTVIDLAVSLVAVLLVLPTVLKVAEARA